MIDNHQVTSTDATGQGLQTGDVVVQVAGWSAKDASVAEVVEQIRKHKERPLKITFATPGNEEDEDNDDDDVDDNDNDDDDGDVEVEDDDNEQRVICNRICDRLFIIQENL